MAVASLADRVKGRVQHLMQGRLACYPQALTLVGNRKGLEIGGPSAVFSQPHKLLPIYKEIGSLDNCDISQETTWASHTSDFIFSPLKPAGKNIFCDASYMPQIPDNSYDFVLSSHNLEHFANPVKALKEWQRVVRPGGGLIVVLPDYHRTFDHRRRPTAVSHMLDDFNRGTGEDDLTHLPEILELHDLAMDPPAGTLDQFRERSLQNITNRCLHHHVFDETNSRELLTSVGMSVLAVELAVPHHIFIVARMP